MDTTEEKLEHKVKGKGLKISHKISKKIFFGFLQEYREAVKYIPKHILENDEIDDSESVSTSKDEGNQIALGEDSKKTPRVQKIEELQKKLQALKGKSLKKVGCLKRKGLKNRLKKKLKLEERKKTKPKENHKKDTSINRHKLKESSNDKDKVAQQNLPTNSDVMFSKFDFPDGTNEDTNKKTGPRDPLRLLQKVQKSEKKLNEMKSRGRNEKVNEIKERLAWDAAIKKAKGEKIKDDVELLKKSIRKKQNAKNRSKKKWEERENSKIKKKDEAQKKRKINLLNKKKEKKKKKIKKLVKKGRIIP